MRASQPPWNNPTMTSPDATPQLVVKTRVFDGILTGLAASAIAGFVWWGLAVAVATRTEFEFWHLGSVLVGLIVGIGVLTGTRRGGLVSGLLALVFASLTVLVTVYFIDRSQTIIALTDAGRTSDIPLWQGFTNAVDVYRNWWDFDQTRPLMWVLGPLVAVLIAGWPNRRPIVG
jgi:hypothetical protein